MRGSCERIRKGVRERNEKEREIVNERVIERK
jgi:hypothetical protein